MISGEDVCCSVVFGTLVGVLMLMFVQLHLIGSQAITG